MMRPGMTGEVMPSDAGRGKTVFLPLELSPQLHRLLAQWCRQTASELEVTGLARAEVLEALITHLVSDDNTSRAVRDRLSQSVTCQHSAALPVPHLSEKASPGH